MSSQMLRNRWVEAHLKGAKQAVRDDNHEVAASSRQLQFRDIRPKAASEIGLEYASRLPGHPKEESQEKFIIGLGKLLDQQNNLNIATLLFLRGSDKPHKKHTH